MSSLTYWKKLIPIREYRIVAIAADCKSAVLDIGGSSPSTPTIALVAQLDRALDYGSRGLGFESLPVHTWACSSVGRAED